jgi:hypothetical protein
MLMYLQLKHWFFGLLILGHATCHALTFDETLSLENSEAKLHYTIGLRVRTDDINQQSSKSKLWPIIGLSYKRWRLGIGDGKEWLRFNSFRKDPSLSYQWIEQRNLNLGVSIRIHNLNSGDAFETGSKTLRSRVFSNLHITSRWAIGVEWTQDVLNRGDSSTLTSGLSYSIPVTDDRELTFNSGVTWAPAEHWRSARASDFEKLHTLKTGVGSIGVGVNYKRSFSKQLAWYSSIGLNKDVRNMARLSGPHTAVNSQIGILYFERTNP